MPSNSDKWSSLDEESDEFDFEKDDNELKIKKEKSDEMGPVPNDLFELFGETYTDHDEKNAKNEEMKNRASLSDEEAKNQEYLSDSSEEKSKEKETNENEKEAINEEEKCGEDLSEEEGEHQRSSLPSEEEDKEEETYSSRFGSSS